MKICTFKDRKIEKVGIIYKEQVIDIALLSDTLSNFEKEEFPVIWSIVELIQKWEKVKKMMKVGEKTFGNKFLPIFSAKKPEFGAPVARESKIICLGKNYSAHAKETGSSVPEAPILFGKFADCVIANGDPIIYPAYAKRIDPEVELAVIMGKTGKNIPIKNAMEYVFGYTIANDITEREMEYSDMKKGQPWFRSKNFDTAMPIGPYIVTKDEIRNPHKLDIELNVNGKIRQKGNTRDMIFKINHLIYYISQYLTLYPGDIISTGTVSGIAPVKKGDVIQCYIEKIGTLKNRVK
ncbi:MAG: fumarylacetoacetate hydrolase family protein [Caldisericaceae bacterium]|nr:fumarylacetoacetate hydrolase family protein [Caldisericaceae bacterium]